MPWAAHVVTLFPEMFPGPLGVSLAGRALRSGLWALHAHDIRAHALDKHKTVDDTPFGGGPGMVMRPDVVHAALGETCKTIGQVPHLVHMTPRGKPLTQETLRRLAALEVPLVILCGHYEGIDQRVIDAWSFEEISLGDFVLSGGEVAALTLLDGIVRLLPGVIGDAESLAQESFSGGMLLEYPQYTRPQEWASRRVPDVLLSGHHEQIAQWRQQEAARLTRDRRPDLCGTLLKTT